MSAINEKLEKFVTGAAEPAGAGRAAKEIQTGLGISLDREIQDIEKGGSQWSAFFVARGFGEAGFGPGRIIMRHGNTARIGIVFFEDRLRRRQVVAGLVPFGHRPDPERALAPLGFAQRDQNRRGQFAFAEIIADGLAEFGLLPA